MSNKSDESKKMIAELENLKAWQDAQFSTATAKLGKISDSIDSSSRENTDFKKLDKLYDSRNTKMIETVKSGIIDPSKENYNRMSSKCNNLQAEINTMKNVVKEKKKKECRCEEYCDGLLMKVSWCGFLVLAAAVVAIIIVRWAL
jgi:hypothetical protein